MSKNRSNFKPFLAYSASAGSGKTFALSVRFVSLLFMGESSSSILAATFTNKAAAEMRQRVVDSLRYMGDNKPFLDAVSEQTGMSKVELFAKHSQVLSSFLSSSSHIVTLDSLFSSILRSASLEIGLEPDFVTKEQSNDKLELYFLDEVYSAGMLHSLVRLAIDIEDKRFGKIFELMQNFYRIDPLLPEIKEPQESIREVENRCEDIRLRLLVALSSASAAARCIKLFETSSTKELSSKKHFEKDTLGEHSWFTKIANDEIEGLFAYLKIELKNWAELRESILLENLFKSYDYYKNANITTAKRSGVLTFDDLTYFTYRLLYEGISKEFLYFKIDAKFKHILLDEFQDTSTLQFLLLKPLVDEIFAGVGQSQMRSFFYVGDTKQSLYRFRGGVEELFDKIAHRYDITIEPMDTNYRSSKSIVEQVNRWFEPIMPDYTPQKSRAGASIGFVEVLESDELMDEAIKQIKVLLDLGIDIDDIALLVHTNKDGQAIHEACMEQSIPTLLKTSSSLRNSPKIASLVAMLSYLYYREEIDMYPLLYRVGKKPEDVDLSWFTPLMPPLKALHRIVSEFGYFADDKNILKLLEFASAFSDIPTFIEEFETSSIAVASHSIHGAKIMTVHGSKGLEFDYVILLDKLTRPNSDKSALLIHYSDELYVDRIMYRTKGRENYDDEYADIIRQRKASALKDKKNVLYVALTRAVEGLIILRKPKDSIFDELNMSTLSIGDKNPLITIDKKDRVETQIITPHISDYGTQDISNDTDEEVKDYEAILFGTALHYALEMLSSFDISSIDDTLTAMVNRYGQELDTPKREQIRQRVTNLINNQEFQSLIQNAKINKEQSISYDGELKQIDLLLEYKDSCLVLDYKSSTKYSIKHQIQVTQYKKAISQITKKPTKGKIVYLLDGEILIRDI